MWKSLIKTVTPLSKPESCILLAENVLQHQLRTTFILKRRTAPLLAKKGQPPRKLRSRHYVYDLVKDTDLSKQPNIELLLTTFVDGLGNPGEKISVKPHYAYTNLLLPGLAVYATPENCEKHKGILTTDVKTYSSAAAPTIMAILSRVSVSVVMNKDSPWTIQPWHVKASLRKCGYIVPEYAITLPEQPIKGPDTELEGKVFYITVTINKTEKVKIKCRIHHWSTDVTERIPHVRDFWKQPDEFIFSEDANSKNTVTT